MTGVTGFLVEPPLFLLNMQKATAVRLISAVGFCAATALFWGTAEALINILVPVEGTWCPDFFLNSVYFRTFFYFWVTTTLALVLISLEACFKLIRPKCSPRHDMSAWFWKPGVIGMAITVNMGWLVFSLLEDKAPDHGGSIPALRHFWSFTGYWALVVAMAMGLAVGMRRLLFNTQRGKEIGRHIRLIGAVCFSLLVTVSFSERALRPIPSASNIVLIVLDAWRADAFRSDLMPNLHSYAKNNALVFRNAWTNAAWTNPAMATMFTGQYPDKHDTRQGPRADASCPTLAQILRDAGFETTAFTANRALNRNSPITDGFADYCFSDWLPLLRAAHFYETQWYGPTLRYRLHGQPSSEESRVLSRLTLDYLDRPHRRPFFLWVHYMDPHGPYTPPPGYYEPDDERYIKDFRHNDPRRRYANKRLYEGECRFMDDQLAPILKRLSNKPGTIVVITADHGEEFWEHGALNFGHGKSVYDTLTRVPLIISIPEKAPKEIEVPVSIIDLMPTLLTLLSQRIPTTIQGRSFITSHGEVTEEHRPVFIGSSFFKVYQNLPYRQDAIISWPRKLILLHKDLLNPGEYYDLSGDPREFHPMEKDETAEHLREALMRWNVEMEMPPDTLDLGGAAMEDLRALGYVE